MSVMYLEYGRSRSGRLCNGNAVEEDAAPMPNIPTGEILVEELDAIAEAADAPAMAPEWPTSTPTDAHMFVPDTWLTV